jgi:subtilisin family serine protease
MMITLAFLLLAPVFAVSRHSSRHHVPNAFAVLVEPTYSCATAVGAALKTAGCDIVFRMDLQTNLASICSYEVLNACDDHDSAISGAQGFIAWFSVGMVDRPNLGQSDAAIPIAKTTTVNPQTFDPQKEAIHTITGVLDARYKLGLTGEGISVAIIDTGVYYLHPALGGGFGPGFKVAFGYDFVGDNFDGSTTSSIVPDDDPMDNCTLDAHGTHVSGIVAADATNITTPGFVPDFPFTGAAPGATLAAYRVFGCSPAYGTSDDIIAAAILRAAQDGADIINLSIGNVDYADNVGAVAAQIVAKAGHIVVGAIGNSGLAGAYVPDSPGLSLGGLGIASFDNLKTPASALYVDGTAYYYASGVQNGNFTFDVPYSIAVNNPNAAARHVLDDGCSTIHGNVTGKAVLLYYENSVLFCNPNQRCNNAAKAGAAACFLYFQQDSLDFRYTIAGSRTIPSLITTRSAGLAIIAKISAKKNPLVVPTQRIVNFDSATGGTVSFTSSIGLTNELFVKPDLGGIGGNVYSTISPFAAQAVHEVNLAALYSAKAPYAVYTGTSMASPYVAGCTALLLEKRGKLPFDEAFAYLMNTATVTNIYNMSLVSPPAYQGAGLVNVYQSATTGTLVTPPSLSLNDTAHHKGAQSIQIDNRYDAGVGPVTYHLSHKPAATANTFKSGDDFLLDQNTTTFSIKNVAKVKFGASGSSTYCVTIKPGNFVTIQLNIIAPIPVSSDLWPLYGGYIAITNSFDNIVTHVPYAGVAGVWKDRDIFARNSTSLYSRWGLEGRTGPASLFGVHPSSVATGLYADETFTPLTKLDVVNASKNGLLLYPMASTTRFVNITITYLCNNDTVLADLGLNRTSFVAFLDVTAEMTSGVSNGFNIQVGEAIRNTYNDVQGISSPHVYSFNGTVSDENFDYLWTLPAGVYQMNFVAWKNFGSDTEVDVVSTQPFQLVYETPLSDDALADCPV